MGGNVSSGQNNDELIDNLIESGLIKSNMVERVFRAVDRGIFYLPKFKHLAYRDLAWREGGLLKFAISIQSIQQQNNFVTVQIHFF